MSDDKNDLTCAPQEHELPVSVALPLFCPITYFYAALQGGFSRSRRHQQTRMTRKLTYTNIITNSSHILSYGDSLQYPNDYSENFCFLALKLQAAHCKDAAQHTTSCKNSTIRLTDPKIFWLPKYVLTFNINSQT